MWSECLSSFFGTSTELLSNLVDYEVKCKTLLRKGIVIFPSSLLYYWHRNCQVYSSLSASLMLNRGRFARRKSSDRLSPFSLELYPRGPREDKRLRQKTTC